MKLLRALENRRILAVTRTCKTKHFKHWSLGQITAQRLRLFMKQVVILKGIKIVSLLGYSCEADGVVEALVDEREELESVEINGSQCTDKSLQLFLQHPKLKVVKLPESNVTGNIELLTSLAVEELDLSYCSNLTDTGLITFLNKTGENLRILDLSATDVSMSNVDSLTTSFSQLEQLNLLGCRNMTDTGLITFLNKTGGNLRILDLSYTDVSFSGIESLTTTFSQLEKLHLAGCKNMTDTGLIAFLSSTRGDFTIILEGLSAAFAVGANIKSRFPNLNVQQY